MPIHDWARVRANRFHHFQQTWTPLVAAALNAGLLPDGYFAMAEQITGAPAPDLVTLSLPVKPGNGGPGGLAGQDAPPSARHIARAEAAIYARKANRVSVRHPDDQVVAVIEIVSPGNKDSRHAMRAFARKAVEFLYAGINLLIVDLFPPNPRNPEGIHKVIWDRIRDEPFAVPPDKPLTVIAYAAGTELVAYVEPLAVGDVLPDMPIFLTSDRYVPCPLEATYRQAWDVYPAPLKPPMETPPDQSAKNG